MSASKSLHLGLCRLCRFVSFGLRDTRLNLCRVVSPPFRGDTATQARPMTGSHCNE
jgi:hypothetical protein